MEFTITLVIILITIFMSYLAEENPKYKLKWIMNPYLVMQRREYLRLITSGFIHSGYMHLAINMFVLYSFGKIVEMRFMNLFGNELGAIIYIIFYLLAIVVSDLLSLYKYQNSPNYNSLGASGAVSAVVFATIIFFPLGRMGILFIPIHIPAFIFGILYLLYESSMEQRGGTGIAHSAHFLGAIFGFLFIILIYPLAWFDFVNQIITWFSSFR
jgi:membrane associated rhomboid family serine protease